ncbi:hypothetical protein M3697_04425 [Janibacter melonis]|uniref:hypothetical protein n=1 Tax=Janibacter melonis TaxID=262209 RepID=UPI0020442CC7|nr:hypothetical protein [Janibacter melonis]MCM3554354.1 hypothetical protein [Janibacter melonis]
MSSWPACWVGVIAATVLLTQDETTGVLGVLLVALEGLEVVLLLGLEALLGEVLLEVPLEDALLEDVLLEDVLLVPVLLETGESPEHAARARTARVAGARR